ncbi:NADH:flavin oxidoreductase [Halomonas sp. HK25]|uniref:NADH:flavin oxidoreductase n=1 Tax=Halomonas sp. HK25 TaxID=3394321 RepID=UPI0039FBB91A
MSHPSTPFRIGPLTLRNRLIKAATNEGMSRQGLPTRQLVRFHEAVAAGGAGLTTLAYCAVSAAGTTLNDQIVLDETALPHLQALTEAVHRQGGAASAQITHGGCFTFVRGHGRPWSASGGVNKIGMMSGQLLKRAMGEQEMEAVAAQFAEAARLAKRAGFDAVEIHMGHGYLLSQFLSPLYNQRLDAYGGDIEGRAHFPLRVLRRVLDAVGDKMAVICKYSMTDGCRGGNRTEEGVAIARLLEREGAHMLVLSAGLNAESITTMFGSSFPAENRAVVTNPLMKAAMFLQQRFQREVPFRELYLLEKARRVRQAVSLPLAYLGGVSNAANVLQILEEGFEAVALGRVLIHDPDFVASVCQDAAHQSGCTHCNRCVAMMYTEGGTSCVLKAPGDPRLNRQPAAG